MPFHPLNELLAATGRQPDAPPSQAGVEAILDTNVVLDWLLFGDAQALPLGTAVREGRLRWMATEAMLRELEAVLSRPGLERWQGRKAATLSEALSLCQRVPEAASGADGRLICSDGDDQKFIDLALARRVPWLFSRDKALLRLARRAAPRGVRVLRPADWRA